MIGVCENLFIRDRRTRLCSMASDFMLLGVGNRPTGAAAPSYLVQESDGVSRFILEDSAGDLLLE
jgi:hypothetical protein